MERLIHRTCTELGRRYDTGIVGPRGLEPWIERGQFAATCPVRPLPALLACLQWKTYRAAQAFRPDLLLAGSGLASLAVTFASRARGIPAICYLHGLDIVADSAIYRALFLPAIRRCAAVLVNSHCTARLALAHGVSPGSIHVLHPGTDLPADEREESAPVFREAIRAGERPILLSVGRLQPRKGLPEFIERSLPGIVAAFPGALLAIVGAEPTDAVRRTHGETARITAATRAARMEAHVVLTGSISEELLGQAYRESDALVFPVSGDVEGFGMVAIEAAAHGLPTVAFAAGGVPDAVVDRQSGRLVAVDDHDAFTQAAIEVLRDGRDPWRDGCRAHARRFSWDRYGEDLHRICESVIASRGTARR